MTKRLKESEAGHPPQCHLVSSSNSNLESGQHTVLLPNNMTNFEIQQAYVMDHPLVAWGVDCLTSGDQQ